MYERSEDPDNPLVKNAELQVSKRQGSMTQVCESDIGNKAWGVDVSQNMSHNSTLNPNSEGLPGISFCILCCSVQVEAGTI